MSTLPEQPYTPALDKLWRENDKGASRYDVVHAMNGGVGLRDNALVIYNSQRDYKNDPVDVSWVSAEEVALANQYLNDYGAAIAGNVTAPYVPPTSKQDLQVPVAIGAPVPEPPTVPTEHHEHAEGWLSKVGHAVTPENIETVASVLSALSKLFGKKRS